MRVEVVLAEPDRCASIQLELPSSATVGDAVSASGLPLDGIAGFAVFGVRAEQGTPLHEGDRVELLRPLLLDPKEARRRRAQTQGRARRQD
jgi:putative ubiquitin-RnfH superfamily antitoxin RatB of RatAB toxin-antitoxin module